MQAGGRRFDPVRLHQLGWLCGAGCVVLAVFVVTERVWLFPAALWPGLSGLLRSGVVLQVSADAGPGAMLVCVLFFGYCESGSGAFLDAQDNSGGFLWGLVRGDVCWWFMGVLPWGVRGWLAWVSDPGCVALL